MKQISNKQIDMAKKCSSYEILKPVLSNFELLYVKLWEDEKNKKFTIVSNRNPSAYMLLHQTDFDPFKRANYRCVVDFVFVPEESRREGIAYDMLTCSLTYNLDLVSFTNSSKSDALFYKAGFVKEGENGTAILVRDSVDRNVSKEMELRGLKARTDLNGTIVKPVAFDYKKGRYECVTRQGEGIRVRPTNLYQTTCLIP